MLRMCCYFNYINFFQRRCYSYQPIPKVRFIINVTVYIKEIGSRRWERERESERGDERPTPYSCFFMNLNIQQPHHMNFISNHQNTSKLPIQQTTFHVFCIRVSVISSVIIYYIYIFAIKERKGDFRSMSEG
jgi:hypothetical protein